MISHSGSCCGLASDCGGKIKHCKLCVTNINCVCWVSSALFHHTSKHPTLITENVVPSDHLFVRKHTKYLCIIRPRMEHSSKPKITLANLAKVDKFLLAK